MPIEIVLQAGTEFMKTAEIPALIAEALFPESPDELLLITNLTKTAKPLPEGKTEKWGGWPTLIDDVDREIIEGFWTGLPSLVLPITEEEFRPYLEAFNDYGNNLDWMLTCMTLSPITSQRHVAEREHLKNMISAIRCRELSVLTPNLLPTDEYRIDSIVAVKEFGRYVEKFQIDVRVEIDDIHGAGTDDGQALAAAKVEAKQVTQTEAQKPWLVATPFDPEPKQFWYTPARYFARQLAKDTPALLLNRGLLAAKVAHSLEAVGIKKRGNKKPFNPGTILKALSNISLG